MVELDAMGLTCPAPVVKARRAIAELPEEGGVIRVLVDNTVACENLERMAEGMGCGSEVETLGERRYAVTLTVGAGRAATEAQSAGEAPAPGAVVAIGRDAMGEGSRELGKILVKGFIYSLTQLPQPPRAVLLFNGGVHLAEAGANTVDDLRALAAAGVEVLVCGTCVNYYKLEGQIAAGEVTNMYHIVELLSSGGPVINL